MHDELTRSLYAAIREITFIDPHSHVDPLAPTAKNLDEILGYHYYTELAHSAGMSQECLSPQFDPRERVRTLLAHLDRIDNTVQYSWFLDIARVFFDHPSDRLSAADADTLWEKAEAKLSAPDWEQQVLRQTGVEKVFLTNEFDDPLDGFDTSIYVPCLRTDTLVFGLHDRQVRERVAEAVGIEPEDAASVKEALQRLFRRFLDHGARACAISLPPDFHPRREPIRPPRKIDPGNADELRYQAYAVFWAIAECCRDFHLPFDLMIGVNRNVYRKGVHQGRDLFDQRTSLIQYTELFNAFPGVTFPVSVLSSGQNQELMAYSWIFPNVVTNGHWWYSNIPAYIEQDCRARLEAVPKTKQIGYYSDAYKLEFILPKVDMYRRVLAGVLAEHFVRPGRFSESQAVDLARRLLRENARTIFKL